MNESRIKHRANAKEVHSVIVITRSHSGFVFRFSVRYFVSC